jgi:tRNA A-37 threonylcarbamoyl transferase component Bud32
MLTETYPAIYSSQFSDCTVFTYDDVIYGRLLLHAGDIGLPGLWAALRLVSQGRGSFVDVLTRGPLGTQSGQEALAQAQGNLSVVLRVEEDRTLARFLHQESKVPAERIRTLYALNRAQGFRESLASHLRREGLLSAAYAVELTARATAVLGPARRERALQLHELTTSLAQRYGPDEGERLRKVFETSLSGPQVRPQLPPAVPAPAEPQGVPAAHRDVPAGPTIETPSETKRRALAAASQQDPPVRPEDCPIYGYEIVKELGKGAMGVVYKARHIFSDRITALKILPLRLAAKTQYLERFKREAMALMRIDHPNVVKGYDFGGSEDYYYLALEFIEGEPLDEILARDLKLPERRALEITRQVALGLAAADAHGVVHRDIKPENVMLTVEGDAKICDFGIVKLADMNENSVTMAGTTVGTPFYISPEQARGEDDLDIRSDIYSLGISLFHLATGRVPFTGRSQGAILVRHILEEVPDPRSIDPGLSPELSAIVGMMTHKKATDRYSGAEELVGAIDAYLARRPV